MSPTSTTGPTDWEVRFIRAALEMFPGSYEIDRDGEPIPLEQLTLDAA
jgi:hypothetical protein